MAALETQLEALVASEATAKEAAGQATVLRTELATVKEERDELKKELKKIKEELDRWGGWKI